MERAYVHRCQFQYLKHRSSLTASQQPVLIAVVPPVLQSVVIYVPNAVVDVQTVAGVDHGEVMKLDSVRKYVGIEDSPAVPRN